MMHGQALARFIDGVFGNVISGFLFLSPMVTFWRIWKKKSTEEFHPYPYLAALMNCMMWVYYGLPFVHPDSTLILSINGFGCVAEICYLTAFFVFTNSHYRKRMAIWVVVEIAVLAIIVACTLCFLHTTDDRTLVVGIICVVFGILMYSSPLSNLREVYKAKSSEFMPLPLILVGCLNGCVWTLYGLLKKIDYNIIVGNGLGAILGFIQIFVYVYYRKGEKKNVEDNAGKVQLAEV